jgi:hypothetical protein
MADYIQGKDGKMQGSRPGSARAERVALNKASDERHYPTRSDADVAAMAGLGKPSLGAIPAHQIATHIATKGKTLGAQ